MAIAGFEYPPRSLYTRWARKARASECPTDAGAGGIVNSSGMPELSATRVVRLLGEGSVVTDLCGNQSVRVGSRLVVRTVVFGIIVWMLASDIVLLAYSPRFGQLLPVALLLVPQVVTTVALVLVCHRLVCEITVRADVATVKTMWSTRNVSPSELHEIVNKHTGARLGYKRVCMNKYISDSMIERVRAVCDAQTRAVRETGDC